MTERTRPRPVGRTRSGDLDRGRLTLAGLTGVGRRGCRIRTDRPEDALAPGDDQHRSGNPSDCAYRLRNESYPAIASGSVLDGQCRLGQPAGLTDQQALTT